MPDSPPPMSSSSLSLPAPIAWILNEGRNISDGKIFFAALCERLVEAGLPLARVTLHLRVLHPQLRGVNYLWRPSMELEEIERAHGSEQTGTYLNSPIRVLYEGASGLRRRLDVPNPQLDFPVLEELRAEGITDYVAMAMPDMSGRPAAITWASDRPGGFDTEALTLLYDMLPILSLVVEVHKVRRIASTLLDVYLGSQTGRRVLQGVIRRGEVDAVHAILWYCDLRGFTAMSDALPSSELIELLDAYFETVAGPVMSRGGEILKFIGDAMLAIFPIDPEFAGDRACLAMDAAAEALKETEALNARRAREGLREIRFGMALHIGDVAYGNIGAPARLDFTVIGPAVNKVVRIEALSKVLQRRLLVSADFARQCSYPLVSLGSHVLRGIREPEEVFAWPDAEAGRLAPRG